MVERSDKTESEDQIAESRRDFLKSEVTRRWREGVPQKLTGALDQVSL
jgi:hypothetical protein